MRPFYYVEINLASLCAIRQMYYKNNCVSRKEKVFSFHWNKIKTERLSFWMKHFENFFSQNITCTKILFLMRVNHKHKAYCKIYFNKYTVYKLIISFSFVSEKWKVFRNTTTSPYVLYSITIACWVNKHLWIREI